MQLAKPTAKDTPGHSRCPSYHSNYDLPVKKILKLLRVCDYYKEGVQGILCLSSSYHKSIPQTGWLKQQKFHFPVWGLEVWDRDASMVRFWWGLSPWLLDDHLLIECSHRLYSVYVFGERDLSLLLLLYGHQFYHIKTPSL